MSRATETRNDLSTSMIEDIHLFIVFIQHEHELLCPIWRKAHPLGCTPGAGHVTGSCLVLASLLVWNRYVFFEVSQLIEYLNLIAASVAHVYETIVGNHDAVGYLDEQVAPASFGLLRLQHPLT